MKKAILCFPFVTSRQPQYPTGVYKVASFCEDFYDVTVLDQRIDTDIIHMISELNRDGWLYEEFEKEFEKLWRDGTEL